MSKQGYRTLSPADVDALRSQLFHTKCYLELALSNLVWSDDNDQLIDQLRTQTFVISEVIEDLRNLDMDVLNTVNGVADGASLDTINELNVYGNAKEEQYRSETWLRSLRRS